MKKFTITLLLLVILLLSNLTFASSTNYTELNLYSITIQCDTGLPIGFASFDLVDLNTGRIDTFNYYDTLDTIPTYINASYYYDYTNDLLLIISEDGTILYDDLNL